MRKLLNAMKMQAGLSSESPSMRMGLVSSYDPNQYAVKVLIQPEDIETGWLPISSEWAGNGWGLFAPPPIGSMVKVEFLEGDFEAGIVNKALFNDEDRPLNVPAGEFWLVHKSGSLLKFHNDGTVEFTSAGTLTVKAPAINLQNVGSALKKLVNETFLSLFDSHVHSNGNAGANTGTPTTTSSAADKTSILSAE